MSDIRYCTKCGEKIDSDSVFCTHCGYPINKPKTDSSNLWNNLNNKYVYIIITGLWLLINMSLLIAAPLEEGYIDDSIWLLDTNFYDFYAYGWGEFFFYGILMPALVWGIVYIYYINKRLSIWISIILSVSLLVFWGIYKYRLYLQEQEVIAKEELKEFPINREFLGCSFGEDYKSVLKKINNQCKDKINISDVGTIELSNIQYGSRHYDSMCFYFYKDKLYKVYLEKRYKNESDKLDGYKMFKEIFEEKSYPHDPKRYDMYSNTFHYLDNRTELELRHSVYTYDGPEQSVQLTYYDINSHQQDEGL